MKKLTLANPMRGGADFKIGSENVFWCECPTAYLRRVGFCDDIWRELGNRYPRDIHGGWYLEDDGSAELARGVVYQLPARKGETRFLYGVADPFNDGPAILSQDIATDKADAALWADQLAERYAEDERDYRRAFNAGARYAELGASIAQQRRATLELIREAKAHCPALEAMPATRRVIRAAIEDYLRETESTREKRAELLSDFGRSDAFNEAVAEG